MIFLCTAITYKSDDFYFGRTLDYTKSFSQGVVITPRNYAFNFYDMGIMQKHYAIIGTGIIKNDYPLYFDAANEAGLCMAGLNFVGNAVYLATTPLKENIASYELIPWILGQCATVKEAIIKLKKINLTDRAFSNNLPPSELHWIIADKNNCVTLESVKYGLKIYENPVGVLTNNPPFPEQIMGLNDYMHLTANPPENRFSKMLNLKPYSLGMGALGLPGDNSSKSRFVRASFGKLNSITEDNENGSISQFFHILETVSQIDGLTKTDKNKYEKTLYTSCINADKCIYYYTTYQNRQISAVSLKNEPIEEKSLIFYPHITSENIFSQN